MTSPTVLVISPLYQPIEEGLAHYTTEFARHLAKVARVVVLTGTASATVGEGPGRVEVAGEVSRWTWLGPLRALRRALHIRPDVVLVQFVPFMYAPRGGINFTLVLLCAGLSLRARWTGHGHVQVMFHELWYPFGWRPKALVMHAAHRVMVFGSGVAARDLFAATSRFAEEVRRNLGPFGKAVHVLAVGSNLERDERPLSSEQREDGLLKIALFGGLHPSKNVPLVLRTLHEAALRGVPHFRLTLIGAKREELAHAVPELLPWLDEAVELTGPLPAAEAASRLSEQDLLLAYFQDGVSSRRGSLLAALCEGVPVVTTYRDFSDEVFANRPFVKLLPSDEAAFARGLLEFLSSEPRPFGDVKREDVRRFYDEHFSWSAVVRRYATLSGFGDGDAARERAGSPPRRAR